MRVRKITFTNTEHYHIYNRGVEKRDIFLDQHDYARFAYLLFACNDKNPLLNSQHYYRGLASIEEKKPRDRLVDIECFCLMPNHFHLLLQQKVEGGVSLFMQKIGTGYTMYFNTKYQRDGSLFQGTFKAKHIDQEEYLAHLSRYIHLNPVELKDPEWKEKGIKNLDESHNFAKRYPWSSYGDFLGQKRFLPILNLELMEKLYSHIQYEQFVKEWIAQDINLLSSYTIEV